MTPLLRLRLRACYEGYARAIDQVRTGMEYRASMLYNGYTAAQLRDDATGYIT